MNERKDAIYNTIGSFAYLGTLWLMSVLVVRLGNFEMAGYFSLAMTSSNLYIAIASYTVRLYYAADIEEKYSDKQYYIMRCFTTLISLLLCVICSIVAGYSRYSLIIILVFYLFKVFEMLSDILFGTMQRHGHLYFAGYSMIIKSIAVLIVFVVALIVKKSLLISLVAIVAVAIAVFLLVDLRYVHRLGIVLEEWRKEDGTKVGKLLRTCFPLLLVGICYNVTPSLPRLVFERLYSPSEFGIYSSLSAVTVLISTAVNCITVPIIPRMSKNYLNKNYKGFQKTVFMLLGITISVGLLAVILTHLFGEWFLVFLFGNAVKGYLPVFYSIIVATVFTSGVICLNAALTAADKQKWALYGNIPGVAICIMLSKFFCQHYFMSGVAYTLIIAQAINALVLGGFLFVVSKSQTKAAL